MAAFRSCFAPRGWDEESAWAVYRTTQCLIALGWFEGIGPTGLCTGWRNPFVLWKGPYEVLRFAPKELGDDHGAAKAERLFIEAAAAR